ncbi:hypothetical protein Tco_1212287 [Tanacetum coccineum]
MALKNTPYPHQRYTVYNTLVNEEESTGFTSIRHIHQEDMAENDPVETSDESFRVFVSCEMKNLCSSHLVRYGVSVAAPSRKTTKETRFNKPVSRESYTAAIQGGNKISMEIIRTLVRTVQEITAPQYAFVENSVGDALSTLLIPIALLIELNSHKPCIKDLR